MHVPAQCVQARQAGADGGGGAQVLVALQGNDHRIFARRRVIWLTLMGLYLLFQIALIPICLTQTAKLSEGAAAAAPPPPPPPPRPKACVGDDVSGPRAAQRPVGLTRCDSSAQHESMLRKYIWDNFRERGVFTLALKH